MALGGKNEVMQSTALSHIDCNISNDLQADMLEEDWDPVAGISSNSAVQGHFHKTHGKSTRETLLSLLHFLNVDDLRD